MGWVGVGQKRSCGCADIRDLSILMGFVLRCKTVSCTCTHIVHALLLHSHTYFMHPLLYVLRSSILHVDLQSQGTSMCYCAFWWSRLPLWAMAKKRKSSGCLWQPIVSLLTTWEPVSKRRIPQVIAKQSSHSVFGCWLEEPDVCSSKSNERKAQRQPNFQGQSTFGESLLLMVETKFAKSNSETVSERTFRTLQAKPLMMNEK